MKNKSEITRTRVKEDFDPLGQIKKEREKIVQDNNEKQVEKNNNENISNSPFDNQLTNSQKYHTISKKSSNQPIIISSYSSNEQNSKSISSLSNTLAINPNSENNKKEGKSLSNKNLSQTVKESIYIDNDKEYEFFKRTIKMKAESLLCYELASFKYFEEDFEGKIIMTDYRFIFIFSHKKFVQEDYFIIPLLMIKKLEKIIEKKNPGKYFIEISTKDNRTIKICVIGDEQHKLYYNLNNYSNPKEQSQFYKFAIKYRENFPDSTNIGWEIYDPLEEYKRQGICFEDSKSPFKIIYNKGYQICETYPGMFILPKGFGDDELNESKQFRTKNRIPVLCWTNKKTGATMWRSSQTKGGITQQRCVQDERLLKLIGELGGDRLIIFDARPYLNALANRLKGAGFENTDNYYNTEIHFCEIDNIHCVRGSITKLFSLCKDNKMKFLSTLEQSQWYEFIHLLLKSAVEISDKLRKCSSVLIHCSDGWDRSSQLITLTEIIMDPYYRTIKGFIVLIEKEWLSFGHQFAYRSGLYVKEMSEDQRAPIFLQWLDSIHQLQYQYPHAFEFNGELLIFLAHHLNTCLYGTFMFNHEKERVEKEAKHKTVSVWSDVLENIHLYKNTFYTKDTTLELHPNFSQYKIRFWEEYFLRWNLNYISSVKKQHQGDVRRSFLNTNYFFEHNKREDSLIIENQKKKLESYEQLIKEICKVSIEKNLFNELPEEVKEILSDEIEYDELDFDNKEPQENEENVIKEENNKIY